jgi:flagellar motor switch/type III secretory pathway protein FliN
MTPPSNRGVVRLSLADGTWIAVEPDIAFAARIAAAVTKRPASVVLREGERAPMALGVFAAIVSASLRKVGYPATMSVLASFSHTAVGGEDVSVVDLAIVAFDETTRARVFFPEARLREGGRGWDEVDTIGLGDAPISLPIIGCRLIATAQELAVLSTGDTWVVGKELAPAGKVWLADPVREQGLCAEIEQTGRVVLRDGVEELSWSPMDETSDEPETTKNVMTAIGDVAVVVRVEIGNATMTAREWSQLRPGDVVGVGARIGDPVTLRVSGHAVAEGELVDVDGEVGVRIRRRIAPR